MRDYSSYQTINVERDGPILQLTINRPDHENALDGQMHLEMTHIFHDVRSDYDAKVIVLTGAGDFFLNTVDFDWYVTADSNDWLRVVREAKWIIQDILTVPQPIVVGLNGDANGFGCSLVSYGDIVVAAEDATMSDPHTKFGLVAGDGCAMTLPLMMGANRAKEYLMLGGKLSAQQLHEMGVVNRVVPREQLHDETMKVARELANMPTEAVQWTKATVNKMVQFSTLIGSDTALGHEGMSWYLPPARDVVEDYVRSTK